MMWYISTSYLPRFLSSATSSKPHSKVTVLTPALQVYRQAYYQQDPPSQHFTKQDIMCWKTRQYARCETCKRKVLVRDYYKDPCPTVDIGQAVFGYCLHCSSVPIVEDGRVVDVGYKVQKQTIKKKVNKGMPSKYNITK